MPLRVGEVARGAQVRPDIVRFDEEAGLLGTALAADVCCSWSWPSAFWHSAFGGLGGLRRRQPCRKASASLRSQGEASHAQVS